MTRTHRRPAVTLLTALLLLTAVATASANRLSLSNRSIRVVWTELEFRGKSVSGPTFRCSITLEGSFHSATIRKAIGALVGFITRAAVGHPCREREMWIHNGIERPLGGVAPASSLPWHITYEGFTGTLPRMTSVLLLLTGIRFTLDAEAGGAFCLAVYGSAEENVIGEAILTAEGTVRELRPELSVLLRLHEAIENPFGIACPEPITFVSAAGNSRFTVLGTTTAIAIRLI